MEALLLRQHHAHLLCSSDLLACLPARLPALPPAANAASLAESLRAIMTSRKDQENFQLVVRAREIFCTGLGLGLWGVHSLPVGVRWLCWAGAAVQRCEWAPRRAQLFQCEWWDWLRFGSCSPATPRPRPTPPLPPPAPQVITHDEQFAHLIGTREYCEYLCECPLLPPFPPACLPALAVPLWVQGLTGLWLYVGCSVRSCICACMAAHAPRGTFGGRRG